MKSNRLFFAVTLALSAGCFHVPEGSTRLNTFDSGTITKGQTTKDQLYQQLGTPQRVIPLPDGSEQEEWTFREDQINTFLFGHRTRGPVKSLDATVRDGVVQDYTTHVP